MSAGLLKMLSLSREDVGELRTKLIETTNQRDAWRAACRRLYDAVGEGGSLGRPMDMIPRDDWRQIDAMISNADAMEMKYD
jgi:hypothetical protein